MVSVNVWDTELEMSLQMESVLWCSFWRSSSPLWSPAVNFKCLLALKPADTNSTAKGLSDFSALIAENCAQGLLMHVQSARCYMLHANQTHNALHSVKGTISHIDRCPITLLNHTCTQSHKSHNIWSSSTGLRVIFLTETAGLACSAPCDFSLRKLRQITPICLLSI